MEFGSINWPPTQENFESGKSFVILLSEPDEENTTQTDATTAAQTSSATAATTTTATTTAAGSTAAPGPGLLAVSEARPRSPASSWATLVAVVAVLASCGLVLVLAFTRRPGSSKDTSKDTSKDSSKDSKDTATSHPGEGAASTLGHQETVQIDEVGWRCEHPVFTS